MSHRRTLMLSLSALASCAMPLAAQAADDACAQLRRSIGRQLVEFDCKPSSDLTTNNPLTTPADNSIPSLPPFAFTPIADRAAIAPSAGKRSPVTMAVPGVQLQARIAGDPTGQARFLLRLPNDWNGRLVVAGASGTRSEFNGDYAWSDYVLQKGYAYASQNKGVLNFRLSNAGDPLACRLNPASSVYVNFFDDDPGQPFSRWQEVMVRAAQIAHDGVEAHYGQPPRYTYAVGTSNGGYQVRRAIETAPALFDGGVDWEGTFVDERTPNLLADLPPALLNWPDYVASGRDAGSTAAKNIRAAGYPPDIVAGADSLWSRYWTSYWELTQCQWQKRLDPAYDTYGAGAANYDYLARLAASHVGDRLAAFATTGRIERPLVTVAGTSDALLPIDHHAREYARRVDAQHRGGGDGRAAYRLYEVQNGNHIEAYADDFPQLELIEPHAHAAFDALVRYVESNQPLPPSQCVPRHGAIRAQPTEPGHCASLLVP